MRLCGKHSMLNGRGALVNTGKIFEAHCTDQRDTRECKLQIHSSILSPGQRESWAWEPLKWSRQGYAMKDRTGLPSETCLTPADHKSHCVITNVSFNFVLTWSFGMCCASLQNTSFRSSLVQERRKGFPSSCREDGTMTPGLDLSH